MPTCEQHKADRQISCAECFTDDELNAEIEKLNQYKLPSAPGTKAKPKRSDDPSRVKKRSWMDDMVE